MTCSYRSHFTHTNILQTKHTIHASKTCKGLFMGMPQKTILQVNSYVAYRLAELYNKTKKKHNMARKELSTQKKREEDRDCTLHRIHIIISIESKIFNLHQRYNIIFLYRRAFLHHYIDIFLSLLTFFGDLLPKTFNRALSFLCGGPHCVQFEQYIYS